MTGCLLVAGLFFSIFSDTIIQIRDFNINFVTGI